MDLERSPEPAVAPSANERKSTTAATRRILHCDMDCFYAQVHMRDDPALRGLPVVIGGSPTGRGVVAAASYEAREFGIRSAMPAAQALKRCPQVVFIRPEFPRYRAESEKIFEIFRRFTEVVQPASLDEAYLDVSDRLEPWGSATAVAREIRRLVLTERGLTVSVGVAPNRLVAKIASDHQKPDGLTVVRPEAVADFLAPLAVRKLHGVGPATEKALADLGITTVAELRERPLEQLEQRFGRQGGGLYRAARGIDERPVRVDRERKSLGHERTYSRDLASLEAMDAELSRLSEKVAAGLERRDLPARTLTVKVRYEDFTTLTRSRSWTEAVLLDSRAIARVACDLLRQTDAGQRRVRLLGVTASGFDSSSLQLRLFD